MGIFGPDADHPCRACFGGGFHCRSGYARPV